MSQWILKHFHTLVLFSGDIFYFDNFTARIALLPTAYKVWGKVMFSQVFVWPGGGCLVRVWWVSGQKGVSGQWGVWSEGGEDRPSPQEMATAVVGTHPTGIHSCSQIQLPTQ